MLTRKPTFALVLSVCVAVSCAAGQPTITASPPIAVGTTPPATTQPSAPSAACPAIRQISLGAVSGRAVYPSGLQNHPTYPIVLVRADDPRVYRLLHLEPPVRPLEPRPYTVTAVEPGSYFAVAYLSTDRSAGFTRAVACGLGATCTDHSLVPVTVRAGETTSGVDVLDWPAPGTMILARPAGSEDFPVGTALQVCNPYADSVNVRASAGVGFPIRRTLDNGAAVVVRGGPLGADGYSWYEVDVVARGGGDQPVSGWVIGYALRR